MQRNSKVIHFQHISGISVFFILFFCCLILLLFFYSSLSVCLCVIPLSGPAVVRSSAPPPRTNELPTSCPVTAITHTHTHTHTHKHSHAHSVYIDTNTRIPNALHVHPAQMKACILCSKECGCDIINISRHSRFKSSTE